MFRFMTSSIKRTTNVFKSQVLINFKNSRMKPVAGVILDTQEADIRRFVV
jgi:hypothetical protein